MCVCVKHIANVRGLRAKTCTFLLSRAVAGGEPPACCPPPPRPQEIPGLARKRSIEHSSKLRCNSRVPMNEWTNLHFAPLAAALEVSSTPDGVGGCFCKSCCRIRGIRKRTEHGFFCFFVWFLAFSCGICGISRRGWGSEEGSRDVAGVKSTDCNTSIAAMLTVLC